MCCVEKVLFLSLLGSGRDSVDDKSYWLLEGMDQWCVPEGTK